MSDEVREALRTVPVHEAALLRVLSNGKAAGAGVRIYVPGAVRERLQIVPGDHYRFLRLQDGRIRLTKVRVDIRRIKTADVVPMAPEARIGLQFTAMEAGAIEEILATGDRGAHRGVALDVAKRIRRRMRLQSWPTVNREADHLERVP